MLKLLDGNLTLISQLHVLTGTFVFESIKEKLLEISTQQFSSLRIFTMEEPNFNAKWLIKTHFYLV
jgi:hypothetical protein